jgi:hypothetical protein
VNKHFSSFTFCLEMIERKETFHQKKQRKKLNAVNFDVVRVRSQKRFATRLCPVRCTCVHMNKLRMNYELAVFLSPSTDFSLKRQTSLQSFPHSSRGIPNSITYFIFIYKALLSTCTPLVQVGSKSVLIFF